MIDYNSITEIKILKKVFTMNTKLFVVFAFLLLFFTGCDYFENGETLNITKFETSISGLPSIPDTMTFVGWFQWENKANLKKIAEKIFVLDAASDGSITFADDAKLQSLQRAELFYITVERKSVVNDSNFVPSSRKILSGSFSYASADLEISENAANLENLSGVYNLATPTDSTNSGLNGVWFVDSISTGHVSGLQKLPELYDGWTYEGWVEVGGQFLSTGRFTDPKKADLFSGYSGSLAGLNFPGEDFLNNAPSGFTFPLNLSSAKVYVSVEYKDSRTNGTSPFVIILEGNVPSGAQYGISYNLNPTTKKITRGYAVMTVDLVK